MLVVFFNVSLNVSNFLKVLVFSPFSMRCLSVCKYIRNWDDVSCISLTFLRASIVVGLLVLSSQHLSVRLVCSGLFVRCCQYWAFLNLLVRAFARSLSYLLGVSPYVFLGCFKLFLLDIYLFVNMFLACNRNHKRQAFCRVLKRCPSLSIVMQATFWVSSWHFHFRVMVEK